MNGYVSALRAYYTILVMVALGRYKAVWYAMPAAALYVSNLPHDFFLKQSIFIYFIYLIFIHFQREGK